MESRCETIIGVLVAIGAGVFIVLYNESRRANMIRKVAPPMVNVYKEPFVPVLVSGPANPELSDPRKPYALLDLPLLRTNSPSQVNSQNCRSIDFTRFLEKSNYGQMTNNFKHEYPDSCSAPFQELVLGVYKPEILQLK
jgi:hypothetical protein